MTKNKFYFSINGDDTKKYKEYKGHANNVYDVAADIANLYDLLLSDYDCCPPTIEIFDENNMCLGEFNTKVEYLPKLVIVEN